MDSSIIIYYIHESISHVRGVNFTFIIFYFQLEGCAPFSFANSVGLIRRRICGVCSRSALFGYVPFMHNWRRYFTPVTNFHIPPTTV